MLTYELKNAAERLNSVVSLRTPFMETLSRLVDWHKEIDGFVLRIAAGGRELNEMAGALHSHIASTSSITRDVDVEGFFASSTELAVLLRDLFLESDSQPIEAIGLTEDLASLRKVFSTFIAYQSAGNALPLLVAATAFSKRMSVFLADLNYFAASLVPEVSKEQGEDELSFVFRSDQTLNSFWSKLKAVEDLYSNLCDLLDVDIATYPLRIAKIESGSMWIDLVGFGKVVNAIGKLLADPFKFLHRNYTTEGRIAGTKSGVEQLDAIIATIGKLDKLKADTAEAKAQAASVAEAITRNLGDLLAHESRFIFGAREIRDGDDRRIQLLQPFRLNRTQRLELAPSSSPPLIANSPPEKDPT